ncbi:hypothetical protein DTL42_25670 [Bremerella cremea]|uniref:Uncharacterized protein n=1 Tax=Bremerella cremea TaxID=1031537 RepID=A0A368KJM0_9BACT|nr:hypothetical protein DTL42_25670 [Bremerella cremea]
MNHARRVWQTTVLDIQLIAGYRASSNDDFADRKRLFWRTSSECNKLRKAICREVRFGICAFFLSNNVAFPALLVELSQRLNRARGFMLLLAAT